MSGALILDHVGHSVLEAGAEKRTMASLNRRFEPGLLNVVGGPSGAGKTTLLSILSLTVRATQGMIHFGETNLTALSASATKEWRRKHIGMVFQTSRLQRLKDFGLGDKLDSRPDKLSGGEKQRVALAQALSFDPPVLLADEPTAALDQHNAELVAHALRAYAREKGAVVVCVSHDRALFDAADDILKLEKA
jgi:putative ABC transport system ATP-binding protein